MQQAGERVIHMEIGRPDFDTPEKIKKAAYDSLAKGNVFYTSNYGTPELRKAIAEWELEKNHVAYDPSEVLVTVGIGEGTDASMAAFLEEGDEVLVPNPVWLNYLHVPSSLGAKPVTYHLKEENNYQIDLEGLESKITDRTRMIVIVDSSNPTGGVFSGELWKGWLKLLSAMTFWFCPMRFTSSLYMWGGAYQYCVPAGHEGTYNHSQRMIQGILHDRMAAWLYVCAEGDYSGLRPCSPVYNYLCILFCPGSGGYCPEGM